MRLKNKIFFIWVIQPFGRLQIDVDRGLYIAFEGKEIKVTENVEYLTNVTDCFFNHSSIIPTGNLANAPSAVRLDNNGSFLGRFVLPNGEGHTIGVVDNYQWKIYYIDQNGVETSSTNFDVALCKDLSSKFELNFFQLDNNFH